MSHKPTAFIGPVGSLVPFLGPSSESISDDRAVSFADTLGMRKAFMGRKSPRTWACELNARYPRELSGLRWLASYGNPPFVWYPPDAVFGNILEPAVAGLVSGRHNGLEGALVEVEPGVWVKSALPAVSAISLPYRGDSLDPVAVVRGVPVTVSGWVRGASSVAVVWRDILGASITTTSRSLGTSTGLVRRSTTLTPPDGAVQMTMQFFCTQLAGPAVSLTSSLTPYSPGKGCKRAVVHGLSEALILVTRQSSLSSFSFTVSEVG